jgi:glycosyltransferase involved in cell wall biosynthesis
LVNVLVEMLSVRLVDAVTGNSAEICESISNTYRIPADRVFLMPTAVDTKYYYPLPGAQREKKPVILYLGRLSAAKGIYDLLDAAAVLKGWGLSFELRLIGDNKQENDLVDKAIQNNNLIGYVERIPRQPRSQVRAELQKATLFVLPSHKEGSPRVVKEALACGCPVVTTDLPGTRMLDPAGQSLTFVESGDSPSMAAAILKLLSDETDRLQRGLAGRTLVERNYSVQVVAGKTYELYHSLFKH